MIKISISHDLIKELLTTGNVLEGKYTITSGLPTACGGLLKVSNSADKNRPFTENGLSEGARTISLMFDDFSPQVSEVDIRVNHEAITKTEEGND